MHFTIYQSGQAKPMKPWQGIVFGLIFVLMGIGILVCSFFKITSYNEKNETYIEITSTVVDYTYNDDGLRAIVVEYTVDGKTYKKASNSYSNVPKSMGSEVQIKYNPSDPADAIFANDSTNILLPIAGVIFTLVGVGVVIFSIKKMLQGAQTLDELPNNASVEQQSIDTNQGNSNL